MPRNVVRLTPRLLVLPMERNRAARERIGRALVDKYRARRESDPRRIEIDFPKRGSRRAAKNEIAGELDRIELGEATVLENSSGCSRFPVR